LAEKLSGGERQRIKNKTNNSTVKSPSTLSVLCIKIQEGGNSPPMVVAMKNKEVGKLAKMAQKALVPKNIM